MARRSFLFKLPDDLRQELHDRFMRSGWGSYEEHAEWLTEELERRGLEVGINTPVSTATMTYTGRTLQEEFERRLAELPRITEMARSIVNTCHDDTAAMAEALTTLMQERLFRIVHALPTPEEDQERYKKLNVPELVRAISSLNNSAVNVKEFAAKFAAEAAAAALESARAEGLSPEQATRIGEAVSSRVKIYLPDNGR